MRTKCPIGSRSGPGLTKDAALVSDLLKLLLKIRAKETGVAARLIARSDDLEALAAGVRKNLNILSGWRYEQFGKDALDLVEGRLAFGIEKRQAEDEPRRGTGNGRCVKSVSCSTALLAAVQPAHGPAAVGSGERPIPIHGVTLATHARPQAPSSSSASQALARPAPRSCAHSMPRCFAGRRRA